MKKLRVITAEAEVIVQAEMMISLATTDHSVRTITDKVVIIITVRVVTTDKADTIVKVVITTDKAVIINRAEVTTVKAGITDRAVITTIDLITTDAPDKVDLTEADNAVL